MTTPDEDQPMMTALHTDHLLAVTTAEVATRHARAASERAHRAGRSSARREWVAACLRAAARRLEVAGDRATDPLVAA